MNPLRSTTLLAAAALVIPGAAVARGAPTGSSIGRTTVLTGSGAVAATVVVPRAAEATGFRLHVRGTYAIVRLVPESQPDCDAERPNCVAWQFRYVRELNPIWSPNAAPGSGLDHQAYVPDPSRLPPGRLRVYVVTDGTATLSMSVADARLPATSRVVARERIRAAVSRVPLGCVDPCVGPARTEVGGAAFDLAGTGFVEFVTARFDASPGGATLNGSHSAVGCFYPNPADPAASPDPRDHPAGCDSMPGPGDDAWPTAMNAAIQATQTVSPSTAQIRSEHWTGARGRVYIGGITRSASPAPTRGLVLGIWIRDSPPR